MQAHNSQQTRNIKNFAVGR